MPRTPDAAWLSVVKLLQQLPPDAQLKDASVLALLGQLGALACNTQSLPRATWKQLIRERKVPLQRATVCCNLNVADIIRPGSSSSSGSSGSTACTVVAAAYAWNALTLFLTNAMRDLVLTGRNGPNMLMLEKAKTNSLPCTITSQLQQSGLLQKFPGMLQAAAQLLQAAYRAVGGMSAPTSATAAAVDDTSVGAAQEQIPSVGAAAAAGAGSSSSSSSKSEDTTFHTHLLKVADEMAGVLYALGTFRPEDDSDTEAAVLDAFAGFCVAFMQYITAALDSLEGAAQLDKRCHRPIKTVTGTIMFILRKAQGRTDGKQLLQLPNMTAALTVLVATSYAQTLLHDGSSSSSSSSKDTGAAAAAAFAAAAAAQQHGLFAWLAAALCPFQLKVQQQQQQRQQQQLDPCRQFTGVSMHAVAWAAAATHAASQAAALVHAPVAAVDVATTALNTAIALVWNRTEGFLRQDHRQALTAAEALTYTHNAEHNLLLLQLLMCGFEQQPSLWRGMLAWGWARVARVTAMTACTLPQCYIATAAATADQGAAAMSGAEAATAKAKTQASQPLSSWVPCMLPKLLGVLQYVQQQQMQSTCTAAETATSNSSSSSSSSSSRSRVTSSANSSKLLRDAGVPASGMALPLVELLSAVGGSAPFRDLKQLDSCPMAAVPLEAWSRHCSQVCAVLETCLRLQLQDSSGSSSSRRPVVDPLCTAQLVRTLARECLEQPRGQVLLAALLAGPGSEEQQQLASLLMSMLKACQVLSAAAEEYAPLGLSTQPGLMQQAAGEGCLQAAASAAAMLACLDGTCSDALVGLRTTAEGNTSAIAAATATAAAALTAARARQMAAATLAAAAAAGEAAAAMAAEATDVLPLLVLVGRCCLQWAVQLQVLQQQKPDLGQRLLLLKQASPQDASTVLKVDATHAAVAVFAGATSMAHLVLQTCRDCLAGNGLAEALAAAGYPAEQLVEELEVLLDLLGQPVAAPDVAAAVAAYGQVVQQLQAVGLAFNAMAFPDACNNPFCSNMSGATELGSVSGRANMCGSCRVAHYCCRAPCQKQHWKQHQPVCQALAAAAAGAAAAVKAH